MKRSIPIFVAFLLAMCFSASAFAAADYSITVKNAKADETYSAYQLFDLEVDNPENPTAYSYKVNSAWQGFTDDAAFKAAFDVDAQGYVTAKAGVSSETEWVAGSVMSTLAEKAAKYAKDNNIQAKASEKATEDGDVKLEVGEAGYYVITSTMGTRAMIETTPDGNAVEVNEKNAEDTIEKTVKEDSTGAYGESNDAQIGDTIEFKSVATIVPRSVNVAIHDTMTNGLTFNEGSIKIYTDEACTTELDASKYEVLATPAEGDTFTIKISDDVAAGIDASIKLFITYTATLNEGALDVDDQGNPVIDPQTNKTSVSFGDGTSSAEDETTTTTHKFSIFKHAKGSTDNLPGAVFSLKKAGEVVKLIKIDDYNYRVANGNEAGAVETFTTVASGDIVIWGVDSDNDYTLEEKNPPQGYNKLSKDVEVTVSADNATRVDVENKTGIELPTTGDIGTMIFYVLGGALVIGAIVMLIARRRMKD